MKFKVLTGTVTDVKNIAVDDKGNVTDYTPTFNKGDIVELRSQFNNYSNNYKKLLEGTFTVIKCKLSDLDNMLTETLYLDDSINAEGNIIIKNPYLVKHFVKVEVEKTEE